jgi:hypothetical protein
MPISGIRNVIAVEKINNPLLNTGSTFWDAIVGGASFIRIPHFGQISASANCNSEPQWGQNTVYQLFFS